MQSKKNVQMSLLSFLNHGQCYDIETFTQTMSEKKGLKL